MLKNLILDSIDLEKFNCAFVIKNFKNGKEILHNENISVPSASLIKIPIMGEVLRQVKEGKLSLGQKITVSRDVKVPFSILTILEDENSYTLKDIITFMIVQSDNTATNILIDLAGMDKINEFIKSIGLTNTSLQRKMMDSKAVEEGRQNWTSALDVSKILELIYKGDLVDHNSSKLMVDIMKNQLDGRMMMADIPDDTVVAHKSGDLTGINHDVGIVYLKDRDYIFSVLTWNADNENLARQTIGKMSKIVYDYFK